MLLTNAGRRGAKLLGSAAVVGVVLAGALSVAPADAAQTSRPALANGLSVHQDANGLNVGAKDANGLSVRTGQANGLAVRSSQANGL